MRHITSALTKPATPKVSLEAVKGNIASGLGLLAVVLSKELKPLALARTYDVIDALQTNLDDLRKIARQKMLDMLLERGEAVTEAGTLRVTEDGWQFEARPNRSGYDPKKVEGLLRANHLDPSKYMQTDLKFSMAEDTTLKMLNEGKFSVTDIEACKYEVSYAVQPPKRVTK